MVDLVIGVGGIIVVFSIAYITSVRRKRKAEAEAESDNE
jgi:hypothetical protein